MIDKHSQWSDSGPIIKDLVGRDCTMVFHEKQNMYLRWKKTLKCVCMCKSVCQERPILLAMPLTMPIMGEIEWGRGGVQKAGDRLPANCGGNLWGVAPWSWKTGEEAGSCAGTPHWAGGGRSCLPPVEQNGHPAAARQCCHSWEQDSNSTWGLYRWDFIIPQFTVS